MKVVDEFIEGVLALALMVGFYGYMAYLIVKAVKWMWYA